MFIKITLMLDLAWLLIIFFGTSPPFLDYWPLFLLLLLLCNLFCFISVGCLALFFKTKKLKTILPFACNLITFLIIYFVPLAHYGEKVMFDAWNEKKYEAIVSELEKKLQHNVVKNHSFTDKSKDVIIYSEKEATFFAFIIGGFLNHYSAYVYSATDTPPPKGPFEDELVGVNKLKKNWYRVEH